MNLINYEFQSQKYVIPYIRSNKSIALFLKILAKRYQMMQTVIKYLMASYNIKKARGKFLDNAGAEVSAYRDEADVSQYFCTGSLHINVPKKFYFLISGIDPASVVTLDDVQFIQKIYTEICGNSSFGTLDDICAAVKIITNAKDVIVTRLGVSGLCLNIIGSDIVLTGNVINYIKKTLSDGIYLEEVLVNGN